MEFKLGNNKIGNDTLIFNMGSATDCPSFKKGLCNIDCYAKKAERQYPQVKPYRDRQEKSWLNSDAFTIAEEIGKFLSKKRNAVKFVRVNESGDFHTSECLEKLIQIAQILPELNFYTYTHRCDLVDDDTSKKLPKNLVINTSDFKVNGLNQFKTFKTSFKVTSHKKQSLKIKAEIKTSVSSNLVCMGDCSTCSLCKINHTKTIYAPIH